MMNVRTLSIYQLLLLAVCSWLFDFWIPLLDSHQIAQLTTSRNTRKPPSWAKSFYVAHNTTGFSSHPSPREAPVRYVLAVAGFLITFGALVLSTVPTVLVLQLRQREASPNALHKPG
ncbi:hypothetical protein C7S18_15990 [Ahniella affigens]|uniref:Uncharacterized protein n=1 Tax=Ahniella affigens TaxID=2021234 RepID=A0A2P1PUR8_9GAMM|nr:hypothetical protein [Ahniella affigens]AVP98597.1 hypothetical protein C7S18_15990 [Ahniella affigens]